MLARQRGSKWGQNAGHDPMVASQSPGLFFKRFLQTPANLIAYYFVIPSAWPMLKSRLAEVRSDCIIS
jgi:hypothetical protein